MSLVINAKISKISKISNLIYYNISLFLLKLIHQAFQKENTIFKIKITCLINILISF